MGADRALRAYLDRYVSRTERRAESAQLEPGHLAAREQTVEYRVRTADVLQRISRLSNGFGSGRRSICAMSVVCFNQDFVVCHQHWGQTEKNGSVIILALGVVTQPKI